MKTKTVSTLKDFKHAIFFARLKGMYSNIEELHFHSSDNDYIYILEAKRREYENYFKCKIQLIEVWHFTENTLNNVELEKVIIIDKHKKAEKRLISKY